ncbi:MAG: isoprenyl transferase [Intrasporangiaceae bacterium]|nr:isoprenyl transferase [Intrasporangiaceae bacterium]
MAVGNPIYSAYERRLFRQLRDKPLPRHVAVMLDGNRRWARQRGAGTDEGYRAGADNIEHLLTWCEEVGVEVVTLWLLSTDNLVGRTAEELGPLLEIIENVVGELAGTGRWRINMMGALDLLPEATAERLQEASARTTEVDGLLVNIAVGYGGRREITDAVRALITDHAARGASIEEVVQAIDVDNISDYLYTKGQPDPDLVIRTSGEQRISGFLMWQSAHTEFYFCEAYWPDFRRVDFLRALRAYGDRHRRFGG